jgi:hypothetical protein
MFKNFYVCKAVDTGNITCLDDPEMFADALEAFPFGDNNKAGETPHYDIVGYHHLLDNDTFDTTNTVLGGYTTATVRSTCRKIPTKLLQAKVEKECERIQRDTGRFPTRQLRKEVAEDIKDALLPSMPLTLNGINFTYDRKNNLLFVEASTQGKLANALGVIQRVTKQQFVPVTPETIVNPTTVCGSITCSRSSLPIPIIGMDALTYFFYLKASQKASPIQTRHGVYSYTFDSKSEVSLSGDSEGIGSGTVKLSGGTPILSSECYAALLEGKRITEATLMFGDQTTGLKFTYNFGGRFSGFEVIGPSAIVPDERHEETVSAMVIANDLIEAMLKGFAPIVMEKEAENLQRLCLDMHLWAKLQATSETTQVED